MEWLWTWRGVFFGYRDGENLWTYRGKHVGKFRGDEVFGSSGEYLGEVKSGNRLIKHSGKSWKRSFPFSPYSNRIGYVPYVDYVGCVMYVGYEDFPSPEAF